MSMSDPIADLLTRLRNAALIKQWQLRIPYSKLKKAILEILAREGYLESFEQEGQELVINLQKTEQDLPVLKTIKRISSPGRRIYVKRSAVPRVMNEYGVAIISTSQGLMTDREARKKALGGEVICEVT
ncbi:MAG: 30S ribosomal protein S8 [bacterium]